MTDSTTSGYDITIEEAGPARKRLTIEVSPETVSQKIAESMATLQNQTSLPGFRKGRVPASLIERRFGSAVRDETRSTIVSEAWSAAMEEHQLQVLGEPEPVGDPDDVKVEQGKGLTLCVEVEVMPSFDLPELDGIEIVKPVIDVNDEHIDQEIDRQKTRHGTVDTISDAPAPGDFLVGSAEVCREGEEEPFFKTEQTRLAVPPKDEGGQFLGLMIDNLGGLLDGCSVGDTITAKTTGPDTHEMEEVRGASLIMTFHVTQAMRVVPLDEAGLLSFFGLDDADTLRGQIKVALERRRDEDQAMVLRRQAVEKLADLIEFELPEKASARQVDRDLQRMRMEFMQSGLNEEEVERRLAEARSGSQEESRRRLKHFFILSKLAERFHVTVSEMETNARIAQIASQNGSRPEQLRAELAQRGQLDQITAMVREDKAADQLVAACTTKEMAVEDWHELENLGSGKPATKKKKKKKKKTAMKKTAAKS
jgi:trigger factor